MRLNISPTPWASLRPRTVAPCHMGAARPPQLSAPPPPEVSRGPGGAGRAGGHLRGARAAAHRRVRAGRLAGTGHRGLSNNLITYQSPAAPLAERTSLFYPSRELPTAQCRYVPCLVSPLTARTLVTPLTVTHPAHHAGFSFWADFVWLPKLTSTFLHACGKH